MDGEASGRALFHLLLFLGCWCFNSTCSNWGWLVQVSLSCFCYTTVWGCLWVSHRPPNQERHQAKSRPSPKAEVTARGFRYSMAAPGKEVQHQCTASEVAWFPVCPRWMWAPGFSSKCFSVLGNLSPGQLQGCVQEALLKPVSDPAIVQKGKWLTAALKTLGISGELGAVMVLW